MKRKLISILMMAMAVVVVGTFNSCKDYEEDNLNEIKGDYATLRQQLADLATRVDACCEDFKNQTNNSLNQLNDELGKLQRSVEELSGAVNNEETGLPGLLEKYNNLLIQISTFESTLSSKLNTSEFNTFRNEVKTFMTNMADVAKQSDITRLEGLINGLKDKVDNYEDWESLKTKVEGLITQANNEVISQLKGYINLTIADLDDAINNAETGLKAQIEDLKEDLDKFKDEIAALKANFASLITNVIVQGTYNPVFGSFSLPANVRSNVLAAFYGTAENNVEFPSSGEGNNDVMYFNTNYLTDKDMEMIGKVRGGSFTAAQNATLLDGDAGTIYLTVNPTNLDCTGVGFSLVNSIDEESPVKLGTLMPSSKKLTFGWTRAASSNGFYEAKATVSEADLENAKLKVDFTKNDVKEILNDVISYKDGVDLTRIVNTVYSAVNDICDANAVKASWKASWETTTGGIEYSNNNSTLSEYSIAATAIKPLFFSSLRDYPRTTFYGITEIRNFVNNMLGKINIQIGNMDHLTLKLKKIELKPLGDNRTFNVKVEIEDEITINGQNIKITFGNGNNGIYDVIDTDGKVIGSVDLSGMQPTVSDITQTITITGNADITDIIKEIYGDLTGDVESQINDVLNDINGFVDNVNEMIDQINKIQGQIDDTVNSISDQINSIIDRINNRLCNIVNGIHDRLQPLAIAYNEDGFRVLSEIKSTPTEIEGATTLNIVPTTYTAEIVAPAFKKHLAVTNVFKDGRSAQGDDPDCKSALASANQEDNMNVVIPGSFRNKKDGSVCSVKLVGQRGYEYEIAYSALGYNGKAVTKKFYVKFN